MTNKIAQPRDDDGRFGPKERDEAESLDLVPARPRPSLDRPDPQWLRERVNDPYGTPNKLYDKDSGEYYDNPFWTEHPPEIVGDYKIIQVGEGWYGYDTTQNAWTRAHGSREDIVAIAEGPRTDVWA